MINVICIEGNLTKDCEVRTTQNGKECVNLSIAFNGRKMENGQWMDDPYFFNVRGFDSVAKKSQYLVKGAHVKVQGELRQAKWEKNGVKHYDVYIMADKLDVDRKAEAPKSVDDIVQQIQKPIQQEFEDKDIPW